MAVDDRDWYREAQNERERRENGASGRRMSGGRKSAHSKDDVEDARIVQDVPVKQSWQSASTFKILLFWIAVLYLLYAITDAYLVPAPPALHRTSAVVV